ncbi:glycoside hydrolase family 13 protein [Abyssalbus ytuae]|uniref:Glycoside hydrolase family 13 protein n=1 Tax=Abyssalbus ytuae TaxID=2926907 RepID=A0A9E7CUQ1_9FLAO|nr:glycoside hydrolase family 13 protein [Abyssalbus ytuae]UOB18792.1 glycoside hydrolase family 13 protein [Abyssalbus ytuae]
MKKISHPKHFLTLDALPYRSKVFLCIALISSLLSFSQAVKVEPPFWWAGMNAGELQLMVYGKNISQYEPQINGVNISDVTKTENPNYLFITVQTTGITPGKVKIDFKKKGKIRFSEAYEFKKRADNSAQRKGFDSSDMIYLLMPDRFANGNESNDSHPDVTEKVDRSFDGGRHGGDIEGIIDHLDYLKELGVTTIWSTPLLEDNDERYSYHTYAQSDVYKIDPRYGTNEDYKRLANEMHKRDMKLVMDYVTNHWGSEHWMIKDLPTYEWIHQFSGYANSNYRMTTQYDPNTSEIDKKYCVDGWFVKTMPDLNQSHPLVLNYLIQNAIWWIEYANLDGFRVDTYSYNDKEGIAKWTKAIMEEYPHFNIVGEVWLHDQAQISYWQKDSPIGALQNYNTHLPAVMDFTLHDAIGTVFNEDNTGWSDGMYKVYENFVNDFLYRDINNLLVFIENHDTARFNHIYNGSIDKYKMAVALIATVRGTPQIYYGSEIGMQGDKGKGDGDIRQDFPGGWASDKNNAFTKEGRNQLQNQYYEFTSKIFNWRKNKKVIHTGKTTQFLPENNVYVYFRYNDNESVMVIINNNPEEQSLNTERFKERILNFTKGTDIITGEEISLKTAIKVAGKSALILELQ